MLGEGHRRAERGTDVVVGFVETHGRPHTAEHARRAWRSSPGATLDLPRRRPSPRWTSTRSWPAARRSPWSTSSPTPTCPGSRNEKRWQDVEELLDAGIDVITTVNIQHLESLNDVVEKITGVPQRETVPDAVVRAADQIELVDMTPEALRRRMAHGNVYAAGEGRRRPRQLLPGRQPHRAARAGPALDRRPGRRGAAALPRPSTTSTGTWEARERVVVALTGGPEGETLIRRAARIAARSAGGDLLAVHVARSDGLTGASPAALAAQRQLVEIARRHLPPGRRRRRRPRRCSTFARAENATQLVLGGSRRSRLAALLTGPGIGADDHPRRPATSTSTSSPTARSARAAACPGSRGSLHPAPPAAGLRPRRRCCRRC